MRPDGKSLAVPGRNGLPSALLEHVFGAEVGETHPEGAHHAAAAPTTGQLNLVGWFFLDGVLNVHSAVFRVLDGVDAKRFLVEVIQLGQFTLGPDDVRSAEQVPGPRPDFPVDDVIVGLGVALDDDFANSELLALHHAHLDVDGVIFDARLNGHRLEREVAVVLVERTQIEPFRIHEDPRFEAFQIVRVASLDAQNGIKLGAAVLGVSRERDFTKMETIAFADIDFHPHQSFRQPVDGIAQHPSVSVAFLVVKRNDLAVGLVEVGFDKFAGLEDAVPPLLFEVFHRAEHLLAL